MFFDQGCVLWVEQLNLLHFPPTDPLHYLTSLIHAENPVADFPSEKKFDSYCFTSNLTLPQPFSLQFLSPSLRL